MAAYTTPPIEQHPDLAALRATSQSAATRPGAQLAECLSLLAGLYLAISPWVVGFHATTRALSASDLITGGALALLALGYGPAYERTHGMGWAAAMIGVWTIIAPWVIYGSPATVRTEWSNIVTGGVVILLALATAALGSAAGTRSRAVR